MKKAKSHEVESASVCPSGQRSKAPCLDPTNMSSDRSTPSGPRWRYILAVGIALALILITLGLGSWVYSENMASFGLLVAGRFELSIIGVLAFSVLAGVASFFSPCAFPLLPGYISIYLGYGQNEESKADKRWRGLSYPLRIGSVCAIGLVTIYGAMGLVVGAIGLTIEPKSMFVTFLVIGVLITVMGSLIAFEVPLATGPINRLSTWFLRRNRKGEDGNYRVFLFFGIGYGLASQGCTLPVLLALIVYTLGTQGLATTVLIFMIYAGTQGVFMVLLTMMVALSKDTMVNNLSISTRTIKRSSGAIMIVVGMYMVLYYFLA